MCIRDRLHTCRDLLQHRHELLLTCRDLLQHHHGLLPTCRDLLQHHHGLLQHRHGILPTCRYLLQHRRDLLPTCRYLLLNSQVVLPTCRDLLRHRRRVLHTSGHVVEENGHGMPNKRPRSVLSRAYSPATGSKVEAGHRPKCTGAGSISNYRREVQTGSKSDTHRRALEGQGGKGIAHRV